jgi:hypothetical protein
MRIGELFLFSLPPAARGERGKIGKEGSWEAGKIGRWEKEVSWESGLG